VKNDDTSDETKFDDGPHVDSDQADKAEERARRKAESGDNGSGTEKRYVLRGASLLDYATRSINTEESLLNNRWLCRGCGAFIVAPSGQGKSVLTAQAAVCFACGKEAFGLKPNKMPLTSVII